jgi:pyruvate kinase
MVDNPQHLMDIHSLFPDDINTHIKLFAKIETEKAIANFDSILLSCDGVIIKLNNSFFTGISKEEICLIESYMIDQCRLFDKTVIFESAANKPFNLQKNMINSFVEHSIKDGVDGILVREDHSLGYIETVKVFNRSINEMELSDDNKKKNEELSKFYTLNRKAHNSLIETIIDSAVKMTYRMKFSCIVVFSDNIEVAKMVSKYRPNCLVIFPCENHLHVNFLRFMRGVLAVHFIDHALGQDEVIEKILNTNLIQNVEKMLVLNLYRRNGQMRNGYYVKNV